MRRERSPVRSASMRSATRSTRSSRSTAWKTESGRRSSRKRRFLLPDADRRRGQVPREKLVRQLALQDHFALRMSVAPYVAPDLAVVVARDVELVLAVAVEVGEQRGVLEAA